LATGRDRKVLDGKGDGQVKAAKNIFLQSQDATDRQDEEAGNATPHG
jgi:hypothetical protein